MKALEWVVVGLAWILAFDIAVLALCLLVSYLYHPPTWWYRWRVPRPDDEPPVESWRRAIEAEDRFTVQTRLQAYDRGLHTRWTFTNRWRP